MMNDDNVETGEGAVDLIPYDDATSASQKIEVPQERIQEVRIRLRTLKEQAEEIYVETAELMYEVQMGEYYLLWDNQTTGERYKSFEEYCEEEFRCKIRKAQYLVKIHDVLVMGYKIPADELRELGWSKAKELASTDLLTSENAMEWVDRAKDLSWRKLVQVIEQEENARDGIEEEEPEEDEEEGGDEEEEKMSSLSFKLYQEQKENVLVAIELAKKLIGSDKKGHLLDSICSEYIAANSHKIAPPEEDV
jgi:hypothetical protein